MSSVKSEATDIFTGKENRDYLHSMIPKKIHDDDLQAMLNTFAKNYISYVSNTQEMWSIVRHLNRLFLQDTDFNPSTNTSYSSIGESIFMSEEINNSLNTPPIELQCPDRLHCQNTKFNQYRDGFMNQGSNVWGKKISMV